MAIARYQKHDLFVPYCAADLAVTSTMAIHYVWNTFFLFVLGHAMYARSHPFHSHLVGASGYIFLFSTGRWTLLRAWVKEAPSGARCRFT